MSESANTSDPHSTDALPEFISHYRILQRLGKGGMGEVFLAEDTKQHGRKVALKVLLTALTRDANRIRRFKHEARAVLALNHPNILTIYELGEWNETQYLATEYIEGETLRQYLWRSRLKIDEALGVAIQVAMALEAAHAAGIVHRDIKPENIMLRADRFARDRLVKVLDFGLAKLTEREPPAADPEAVTIPITETNPGTIIGTTGYMSPEQAEGEEIDARSDVFSLGVVIYEMVAGTQPFKGRTDSHTRVSILDHDPPSLAEQAPETPRQLERIIYKALAKHRDKRYQTVTDLKLDLEQVREELQVSTTAEREHSGARLEHPTSEARTISSSRSAAPQLTVARSEQVTAGVSGETQTASFLSQTRIPYLAIGVILMLVAAAALYVRYFSGPEINSVAVLPFVNDSGDSGAEYLSDGLSESIINSLAQVPRLRVMSRNAVFRFKGKADPQAVGRELNVGAVLTGRLVKLGDRLLVKTELIRVSDGSQLWGSEYNTSLADILSVQNEVSEKITEGLRVRLTGEDKEKIARRYTHDAEAYQLYLRGRYFWNKRNEEGFRNGINYFKQAEERDPTFALAFSGLADSYALLCDIGVVAPVNEMPKARAAAQKAVDADPSLAEAYTSRAFVKLAYDWDWPGAEADFKQALQLNPKYPTAHQWYASYLMQMGKFDRAKDEIREAHSLDPLSPIISSNAGLYSYYDHNYDDAITKYKLTLQNDPEFWVARHYLALAYVQKGMFDDAVAELRSLIKAPKSGPIPDEVVEAETEATASLGFAYGMAGKRAEAQAILDKMHKLAERRYVSGLYFAIVYTGLKDHDHAMEHLDKAFQSRHPGLVLIRIEPMFDGLRSDERFKQLVKRFEPMP